MAIRFNHGLYQLSPRVRTKWRVAFFILGVPGLPILVLGVLHLIYGASLGSTLMDYLSENRMRMGLAFMLAGVEAGIGYVLVSDWAARFHASNRARSPWAPLLGNDSPLSSLLTILSLVAVCSVFFGLLCLASAIT